ncbi:MAG: FxLYD domain-containing protein [Candidatus Methanofastidiosum sp.]|nr:FxLYD domain-containing protein [Methanofastidiosum sp.]
MSRKLSSLIVIITLISAFAGCSSKDNGQTAKDVLEDWRKQNFNPIEETSSNGKTTTVPNPIKGETPSGSIACPMQIKDYKQRFEGNRVYIQGNVYNYGDASYKNPPINCVKLYIFFYNSNGNVIGEDSYYVNVGELDYGEKYPFSVSANIRSGTERYLVKVRCCNR